MKRILVVSLLVVCLVLPLCASAESWADFVKSVCAATKDAEGEVVYEVSESVDSCKKSDKALHVPDGVQLIIQGGTFGAMRLGSGDIELRDVTALVEEKGQSAIYIPQNGKKPVHLKLTVGQNTEIHSAAVEGDAIGTWDKFGGDSSIILINYGTITSDQGFGVLLRIQAQGSSKANVYAYNYGTVTGGSGAIFLAGDTVKGDSDVWLHNEGSAIGEYGEGLFVRGLSQTGKATGYIWNAPNGMAQGFPAAIALHMECPPENSNGEVINRGTASGNRNAILLSTSPLKPVTMQVRNDGKLLCSREDHQIAFDFFMELKAKKDAVPAEDAFVQAIEPWMQQVGIEYFPSDIQAESYMTVLRNDGRMDTHYQRTVAGGGQPLSKPLEEKLPTTQDPVLPSAVQSNSEPKKTTVVIAGETYPVSTKELSLPGVDLSNPEALAELVYLTKLKRLDLSHCNLTDLTPLAGLTALEDLDLYLNTIRDISPLAGLTELKVLKLGRNQVADISALKGHKNLVELSLFQNRVSDITALSELTQLEHLNIGWNPILDISAIGGMQKLIYLGLKEFHAKDLSILADLPTLKILQIDSDTHKDWLALLPSLPKLEMLEIEKVDGNLAPLAEMSSLSFLTINNPIGTDYATLPVLPKLETLSVDCIRPLPAEMIAQLKSSPKLRSVTVFGATQQDVDLIAGNLPNVKNLELFKASIENLNSLSNMKKLESLLLLSKTKLDDLSALHGLKKLRDLSLGDSEVSADQIDVLQKALPKCDIRQW